MKDKVLQEYIYSTIDKPYCFLCKNCERRHNSIIDESYCTVNQKYVPEFKMGNELCFEHQ